MVGAEHAVLSPTPPFPQPFCFIPPCTCQCTLFRLLLWSGISRRDFLVTLSWPLTLYDILFLLSRVPAGSGKRTPHFFTT